MSLTEPPPTIRNVGRVRSAIAYNAVFRLLSQLGTAVAYILLVRFLSENEYGLYQLFYSVPVVIGAVFSLGIANALSRFLPEYLESHRFGLAKRFVSWCLRARFLISIVVLSAIIYFWDQITPIFKIQDLKDYFFLFAAITVTHFQCRILILALSAYLLQKWSSGLTVVFTSLKIIGYVAVSANGLNLAAAFVIDLVAYLVWYVALRVAYAKHIPGPNKDVKERFSRAERRRVFRYAAFYNFNDVGSLTLSARSDFLFIAGFMNPLAVGAYAFCTQLDAMLQKLMPMKFFMGVIQPLVFTLDYETQKDQAGEYFRFLTKISYLVQFPIFFLILSVPAQIITVVFAGKFVEYSNILVATVAFSSAICFHTPLALIAQLAERAGIMMASKIFSVYNIIANVVLIPQYGIIGAVVATGSAQIFKNIFIWSFVRDVASFRGMGRFFLNQAVVWLCCWALLRTIIENLSPIAAVILSVFAVAITSLIGLRFASFEENESVLIRKVGGRRISQILSTLGIINES